MTIPPRDYERFNVSGPACCALAPPLLKEAAPSQQRQQQQEPQRKQQHPREEERQQLLLLQPEEKHQSLSATKGPPAHTAGEASQAVSQTEAAAAGTPPQAPFGAEEGAVQTATTEMPPPVEALIEQLHTQAVLPTRKSRRELWTRLQTEEALQRQKGYMLQAHKRRQKSKDWKDLHHRCLQQQQTKRRRP
ncbi:hypothetical protein cyc_08516 [Cyclospora cayetanensis]|uniref:Uncharacterized protein n=1 Tax=Cyclospora cayetanensis TaxID=88456 RepID=A0A1D3D5S7_9EIME|nr:hypothetical protein cyc_08516 [Cyclospora cayetanensis]